MEKEGDLFAALDNSARHFNPVHHFTVIISPFYPIEDVEFAKKIILNDRPTSKNFSLV